MLNGKEERVKFQLNTFQIVTVNFKKIISYFTHIHRQNTLLPLYASAAWNLKKWIKNFRTMGLKAVLTRQIYNQMIDYTMFGKWNEIAVCQRNKETH